MDTVKDALEARAKAIEAGIEEKAAAAAAEVRAKLQAEAAEIRAHIAEGGPHLMQELSQGVTSVEQFFVREGHSLATMGARVVGWVKAHLESAPAVAAPPAADGAAAPAQPAS